MAPGKITGPGSGRPPVESTPAAPAGDDATSPVSEGGASPKASEAPRFADKLSPTGPVAAGPPAPISGTTAQLAADLQAGRITPRAAIDSVIDRVVDKQLGTNAPAPVRAKLRAALEDAVADDPLLTGKIKALE